MIRLTAVEMTGPPRPITINSEAVSAARPRRGLKPVAESQAYGHVKMVESGSVLHMVTGEHYNVLESYDQVEAMLTPDSQAGTIPKGQLPDIPQTNVTGLSTVLSNKTDLPVSEGTPEHKVIDASAQSAPAKRGRPKKEPEPAPAPEPVVENAPEPSADEAESDTAQPPIPEEKTDEE